MGKKAFVGTAVAIERGTAVGRQRLPMAPATAAADGQIGTVLTGRRTRQRGFQEVTLKAGGIQLGQCVGVDVAQSIFIQYVKVTGIKTAVGLHHQLGGANPGHTAGNRRPAAQHGNQVVKILNVDEAAAAHIGKPQVKQITQKLAVQLGRQRKGIVRLRFVQRIEAGDVLLVDQSFFHEKRIDGPDAPGGIGGNDGEHIEVHLVPEQVNLRPDLGKAPFTLRIQAVAVVIAPRAVKRQADQKLIGGQEGRPVFIQQNAVGLDAMLHRQVPGVVLLDQADVCPIERQTGQGGFAALKGDGNPPFGVGKGLLQEAVQGFQTHHAQGALCPVRADVGIKTVATAQIAGAGSGFDQELYRRHRQSTFQIMANGQQRRGFAVVRSL